MILRIIQIYVFISVALLIFFSESVPEAWVDAIERTRTGWLVLGVMAVALAVFVVLNLRRDSAGSEQAGASRSFARLCWPVITLVGLAVIIIGTRVDDGPTSTQLLRCCLLIGGMLAGQVVRFVAGMTADRDQELAAEMFLLILCLGLAISPFYTSGEERFVYWGQNRWSGPWENPNVFGLLMAVGVVAIVGQLLKRGSIRNVNPAAARDTGRLKNLRLIVLTVVLIVLGIGLFKSYSRGAWLAALLGIAYLLWQSRSLLTLRRAGWLWRNGWALACCLVSVVMLTFYSSRHVEWAPARRVTSVANKNDFSWRNRVRAWEGALQSLAEKPWFGNGPVEPDGLYTRFYRNTPTRYHDTAILLNDYGTLGMTFGLICLFGLAAYVSLRFSIRDEWDYASGNWNAATLRMSAHAAVIAMLTVFFFDGGLFKMPTAIAFWALLEISSYRFPQRTPIPAPCLEGVAAGR